MPRILPALASAVILTACSIADRGSAACDVLSADEIAGALQVTGVRQDAGSGVNSATGIDTCRWAGDGGPALELRVYRADSSAEGAWKMVFESARAHAMKPDSAGQVRAHDIRGVGDEAMFLPGSGGSASVAFRVGRTGAVIAGRASRDALVELARRAAGRL